MESTSAIVKKTTIVEEKTMSAANYAGLDTQLKTLSITGGTFSIIRNYVYSSFFSVSENRECSACNTKRL